MKLKKYAFLLAIPTLTAVITTPFLIANNQNNLSISKTNVAHLQDQQEASTSTTTTTSETSTVTQPELDTIDVEALTPKIGDLFNDYAFDSGYIVIKGTGNTTKIGFYNWFKQNLWTFDLAGSITTVGNDADKTVTTTPILDVLFGTGNNKTIQTLKIKGGHTEDGGFDGKTLFVYGNFTNNEGAYVFELDMTTGNLINLTSRTAAIVSLSVEETKTAAPINNTAGFAQNAPIAGAAVASSNLAKETINSNLVSDANLLTVVDENTLIITESRSTMNLKADGKTTTTNPNTFNFTMISLGSTSATVTSYYNVYLVNESSATATSQTSYYDGPIGVIKENNNLMFAIPSLTKNSNNYDLKVWNFFYALNAQGVMTPTKYTTSVKELSSSNTSPTSFDSFTFNSSITTATIAGSESNATVNQTNAYAYLDKVEFSTEVVATSTSQKMIISMDYDSTSLTITPSGENATSKLMVMSLDNTAGTNGTSGNPGGNPKVYTYTAVAGTDSASSSQTSITIKGISNLIYTRDNSIDPYALVLGSSSSSNALYMGFVALSSTSENTTLNSSTNNVSLSSPNTWYKLTGAEGTSSWEAEFVPGTKMVTQATGESSGSSSSSSSTAYFAYLDIFTQKTDAANTNQTYFISVSPSSSSTQANKYTVVNTFSDTNYKSSIQSDYQFGITDAQIASKYKANTDLSQANIWADETTKDNLAKDLAQELAVTIDPATGKVKTGTQGTLVTKSTYDTSKLNIDPVNGTITGSISFEADNWWNNNKSTITRNVNIQLNKGSDYQLNLLDVDTGIRAKYVEAKYDISGFDKQAFLQDAIDSTNMGAVLKQLLGFNSTSTNTQTNAFKSSLQSSDATSASSDLANYLTVKNVNGVILVSYDLTSLNIPTSVIPLDQQKGELVYSNFTGKITNSSDANNTNVFPSFQDWEKQQLNAATNTTPTNTNPTQTTDNNTASSNNSVSNNNGLLIASLIISIIAIIAVVGCLFLILKKRKYQKYE